MLGNSRRRASFATTALGPLAYGERTSVAPVAARAGAHPDAVEALHQRLLHVLADFELALPSAWPDNADHRREDLVLENVVWSPASTCARSDG